MSVRRWVGEEQEKWGSKERIREKKKVNVMRKIMDKGSGENREESRRDCFGGEDGVGVLVEEVELV